MPSHVLVDSVALLILVDTAAHRLNSTTCDRIYPGNPGGRLNVEQSIGIACAALGVPNPLRAPPSANASGEPAAGEDGA